MNRKETLAKRARSLRRATRVRASLVGTKERPRLSVYRSHRYISAQLIDDVAGHTLASATDMKSKAGQKPMERATAVGADLAAAAKKAGILTVIFDRGPYLYHGRVKALAEAAREGGLVF